MIAHPDHAAAHLRGGLIAALGRFVSLPASERLALCEAAFLLLIVRATLALLPLPLALRLFGIRQGKAPAGQINTHDAEVIARAIARAACHVPFRAVCLQQAFTALLMLRRRGLAATVHLGVLRDGEALKAHAWSRCGDIPVTGAAAAIGFTPIAVFAA